jgi:hypothetical protein
VGDHNPIFDFVIDALPSGPGEERLRGGSCYGRET